MHNFISLNVFAAYAELFIFALLVTFLICTLVFKESYKNFLYNSVLLVIFLLGLFLIRDSFFSTSIENAIFIEGVSLQYISMECNVESGMELTQVDDDRTHIRYAITTSFNISGQLTLGQNAIQILYQPTAVDGSITSLSEQHPMSVSISGQGYAFGANSNILLETSSIT